MGIQEYLPQKKNVFGLFHSAGASQKKVSQTQWIQFLFFSWDRNSQTMAHSLNLAHCFCTAREQKMDFTFLNIWRKKRIPFCNTWTLYYSWISVQAKLCDNTDMQVCSHMVSGLLSQYWVAAQRSCSHKVYVIYSRALCRKGMQTTVMGT